MAVEFVKYLQQRTMQSCVPEYCRQSDPHSMPVHYVPLGLDAAISEGVKDLKITNTLDVPIMIYAKTKQKSFDLWSEIL